MMLAHSSSIGPEAKSYSHSTLEVPSEKATSEVNVNKLHKPCILDKQPVIFPNNLHVPEDLKKYFDIWKSGGSCTIGQGLQT